MKTFPINDIETNYEVRTSVEELNQLVTKIKLAIENAQRGQVLRVKIANNICLVINDLGKTSGVPK